MTSSEALRTTETDPEVESVLVDTDTLPVRYGWTIATEIQRMDERRRTMIGDGPLDESTIPDWLRR